MSLYSIPVADSKKEAERIKELDSYQILDTLPDNKYDDITRLASYICGTDVSLITLMDSERNWYKSIKGETGLSSREIPRDISFCKVTIQGDDLYEVKDTAKDILWKDNPIVTEKNIRYYAGYPLVSPNGYKLGTLCVVERWPMQLNASQKQALRTLANSVVSHFELDKNREIVRRKNKELAEVNARLYQFAKMIAHDLKSPLQSIKSLYELMRHDEENAKQYKEKMFSYLDRMGQMIDGLLAFSRNNLKSLRKEKISTELLLKSLMERLNVREVSFSMADDMPVIKTEGVLLEIIFQNLISNSIKYCNCEFTTIEVGVSSEDPITFFVKDNGPGISQDVGDRIFDPFERIEKSELKDGNGIGLYTVKTILMQRGCDIWYESEPDQGTTFFFEWRV
ncbi:HAMP domain-containing sensor histidine kinase [Ekhidna sp.]|uniref:GAF domain-containing sensor histidine kinase n=1 Tax=Ekhidna sp. TaxID=2608089 RepID=UPI003297A757